jgi:class 3 adenylate cyclase/tetratricopeptide (TPR) repeat protein
MRTCPTCGEENPDRARFCLACGTDLDAAAAAPAGAEERKVVSVLFVDLVGFTQASDAADPEDVRARLRPYHAALKREIERFGGTVEKFIGDAVMAVFGAPVAHEDDAERAVRAALRILDAIPELNEEHPGLDLAVRAAVNTGEAVVSLGARPERGEGLVAGDVVNTASRLQGAAPVGAVVVGEITHRATRDVFRYEELAPVAVKGKSEPVALWRTIEARGRYGVDVERPRTPFVGREEDLGVLQQTLLRSIRDPGVQLVTITGEPGVGKTRLVAEFQAWVDDRPELVFWRQGRCLPYGDGIAFWALGEVVKAHAGILESDGPPEAAAKLAATVDGLAEEADRDWIRTRLEPLVGLEAPGSRSTDRTESFAAWRAFLEAIAAENPLVLVLEDLHWADETMLEFVDDLVDWASGVALTVICTARPELFASHPGWGGGKRNSATLGLAPLSGEDTARLISALLDRAVLPAETQSLLMERAGGNPLYAEEFVRMLVDRGILQQHGQAWTVVADGEVPVPETVQATIAARLDALGPDHKAMLQDASVVGKVFWSGVVAAMGDRGDHDVREGLHELARKELIRPARRSSVEGQAEYAFWHALVRDVTYGQLPRPARIRKHRAAAAWIEELAGDRVADQVELLVHHEREALGLARATGATDEIRALEAPLERHLVTASERNEGLDLGKAESFAREAVELAGPEDRGAALTRLANVLFRASRHREAVDAAREAVRAFEATGQEEEAFEPMVTLPVILWQLGDTEDSAVMFHDVIERLEARPPSPVLAKAYTRWAGNAMISGDSAQTLEYAGKAIPLCERFGLVDERARALQFRGSALCEIGQQEAGVSDLRESLRICLELGLADVPVAYVNLGDWIWEHEGPSAALERRDVVPRRDHLGALRPRPVGRAARSRGRGAAPRRRSEPGQHPAGPLPHSRPDMAGAGGRGGRPRSRHARTCPPHPRPPDPAAVAVGRRLRGGRAGSHRVRAGPAGGVRGGGGLRAALVAELPVRGVPDRRPGRRTRTGRGARGPRRTAGGPGGGTSTVVPGRPHRGGGRPRGRHRSIRRGRRPLGLLWPSARRGPGPARLRSVSPLDRPAARRVHGPPGRPDHRARPRGGSAGGRGRSAAGGGHGALLLTWRPLAAPP